MKKGAFVLLALLTVAAGCSQQPTVQENPNTLPPVATSQSEPTVPKTKEAVPYQAPQTKSTLYVNSKYGFTLSIPETMKYQETQQGAQVKIVRKEDSFNDLTTYGNLTITVIPSIGKPNTWEEFQKAVIAFDETPAEQLATIKRSHVGNYDIYGKGTLSTKGTGRMFLYYIFNPGKSVVSVASIGKTSESSNVFEKIAASIKY
jgi:hypothetical protein